MLGLSDVQVTYANTLTKLLNLTNLESMVFCFSHNAFFLILTKD